MKFIAVISISILISLFFIARASYSETSIEYIYIGLPSSPLDREDSGDDIEEDSDTQESDSGESSKNNKAPRSDGNERFDDWYEPEHTYQ